jgi:hypothetical protein
VIEKKMFSNTEELLPVISFNAKGSAEEQRKHEDFVNRMVAKGYTPKQVRCFATGICACASRHDARTVPVRSPRGRFRGAARMTADGMCGERPGISTSGRRVLHQIIDRRLAGKNKSIANRERFLRRVKSHSSCRVGRGARS